MKFSQLKLKDEFIEGPRSGCIPNRFVAYPEPRGVLYFPNFHPRSRLSLFKLISEHKFGIALSILVVLDGLLTFYGVSRFGISAEGNPLLRLLMQSYGPSTALAVAKTISVGVVCCLTISARNIAWVEKALVGLCCVYLFAAVLPWTYLLYIAPNLV